MSTKPISSPLSALMKSGSHKPSQKVVSTALHDALDYVLARNVADYRDADHLERRLLQVADYICTIERVSDAYSAEQQTNTHERFFGSRRSFMQSYMKQLERKRLK